MKKIQKIIAASAIVLLAASCNLFPTAGGSGGGVLKSRDTGDSWDPVNKLIDGTQLGGVTVARIRLDSGNRDRLYFASSSHGVYVSENRGDAWQRVLSGPRVYDLQVNPADGAEVYAGGFADNAAKLFKTRDGGQTWIETYSQTSASAFVSAVNLAQRDPKVVFIGLSTGELMKSVNAGASWDLVKTLTGRILKIEFPNGTAGTIYALTRQSGLWRSNDGGKSWNQIPKTDSSQNYVGGESFEDFTFAGGEGIIYVASNRGLFRTFNSGGAWERLELPLHDANTTITAVAVNPKNTGHIYTAVGQTFYKSTDSGATWQTVSLPVSQVVRNILIDSEEPNVFFAAIGAAISQ